MNPRRVMAGALRRLALAALCLVPVASLAEAPARWVIDGPVAYDRKTALTWQRCSVGQTWQAPGTCAGEAERVTFDEALKRQADGWRVPTLDELRSILVRDRKPTIDLAIFPGALPVYYWSTDSRDTTTAWYVYFENGQSNHYFPPRTNQDVFRLVRTGRWSPAK